MAKPAAFPQFSDILKGSPEDRAAGTVLDLPILRYRDHDQNPHVISCWQLDEEELAEVARTGRVWLHSWGLTHPPIAVAGTSPFATKKENDHE